MAFATFDIVDTSQDEKEALIDELNEFNLELVTFAFGYHNSEVKISGTEDDLVDYFGSCGYSEDAYFIS